VNFTIDVPAGFRFRSVVLSHGWSSLPPFAFDTASETLSLNLLAGGRVPATAAIAHRGRSLSVSVRSRGRLREAELGHVGAAVRSVLRLDADLAPLYKAVAGRPGLAWIRKLAAGRLLRAPSVFEDAVKMICTTNCSWALTTMMVKRLCDLLGSGPAGAKAFPTPGAMAERTESFYRKEIRSGYRSPFLVELARRVAEGKLDIERWRDPAAGVERVREEMRSVNGIGPYAEGNLLKLVGRYGELGIDSWCRKQFAALHRNGRKTGDAAIERHYAEFGEWKGLVFWLDLTRPWYEKPYEEILPL
jgi:N-glycosylase/DNA lyase